MKNVLFDTNILIDIALKRQPFFEASAKSISYIGIKVNGFVNALTLVNFFYLLRKEIGIEKTKAMIADFLNTFDVVDLNKDVCKEALLSGFNDFEDAIQNFSAQNSGIDIIVTRNTNDYKSSNLQIIEPKQFIEFIEIIDC